VPFSVTSLRHCGDRKCRDVTQRPQQKGFAYVSSRPFQRESNSAEYRSSSAWITSELINMWLHPTLCSSTELAAPDNTTVKIWFLTMQR